MAEWSNAAVLKTVMGHTIGGSNPSFSATNYKKHEIIDFVLFFVSNSKKAKFVIYLKKNEVIMSPLYKQTIL